LSEHSFAEGKAKRLETSAERDRILLTRVAQGDREAFQELFDRLAPIVLGYVGPILRNQGLTEEIIQEIFLRLWVEADRYRPELGTPCVWLLVMARSRALDHLRREASRRRREAAFHGEPSPLEPIGTTRLELLELRRRVRRALDRLSPEQQACLSLAFEEDLSHGEIAQRLAMPLGSVKSRVRLGMKKLGLLFDRISIVPILIGLASLGFASIVLAGPLSAVGLFAGAKHPLTGLDHLVAMIAVGLWAGQMGGKARWSVPCAFVGLMLVGGALGFVGVPLPFVESGVVASVFVLGLLVAAAVHWRPLASVALVGVFAIFHGHAHATEVAAGISGLDFVVGFAFTTAALHGVGLLLAAALERLDRPAVLRFAGALVACSAFLL
jgi:urease accessory protein